MKDRDTKYWIVVASKEHVNIGIDEGIAQACHGKEAPLKRMRKGNFVIYYSSKLVFGKPEKCQEFTAIGQVLDDEVYQFQMTEDFSPFRRNIRYIEHKNVPILPLINELHFIQNKKLWGYPFRYGILEISKDDFDLIAAQMMEM